MDIRNEIILNCKLPIQNQKTEAFICVTRSMILFELIANVFTGNEKREDDG